MGVPITQVSRAVSYNEQKGSLIVYKYNIYADHGRISCDRVGTKYEFEFDPYSSPHNRVLIHRFGTGGTLGIMYRHLNEILADTSFYKGGKAEASVYIEESQHYRATEILNRAQQELRQKCREHFGSW